MSYVKSYGDFRSREKGEGDGVGKGKVKKRTYARDAAHARSFLRFYHSDLFSTILLLIIIVSLTR